ncbi:unnamed protein product [Vicia faba]|uniref:Uncharacterized protein n=1 Tax=Vicia faba TaxID=3906 RepID=A0AAV0Z9E3_VICFA|nr:unnamed protein product [Vicia faba]
MKQRNSYTGGTNSFFRSHSQDLSLSNLLPFSREVAGYSRRNLRASRSPLLLHLLLQTVGSILEDFSRVEAYERVFLHHSRQAFRNNTIIIASLVASSSRIFMHTYNDKKKDYRIKNESHHERRIATVKVKRFLPPRERRVGLGLWRRHWMKERSDVETTVKRANNGLTLQIKERERDERRRYVVKPNHGGRRSETEIVTVKARAK